MSKVGWLQACLRWGLLVALGTLLLARPAAAATVVRAISNESQLMQLFADANADTANIYQGNLALRTYALTSTLSLSRGRVILRGGSDVSSAASYVLDCQGGCVANGSQGRVLLVERDPAYQGSISVQLWGVTLTGGNSTEFGFRGGGGAYVGNGSLEIHDSVIRNNRASQWGAGLLAQAGGVLSVLNSMVQDNTNSQVGLCGNGDTSFAGGIGVLQGGWANIAQSSVTGNKACKGAGVAVWGSSAKPTQLIIYNSTISRNEADRYGGGVVARGALTRLEIAFSTIAYNKAGLDSNGASDTYGGGLAFRDFSAAPSSFTPPIRMWGTVLAKNQIVNASTSGPDCFANAGSVLDPNTTGVASNFIGKNGNCGAFLNWTSTTGGTTLVGTDASPLDPVLGTALAQSPSPPLSHSPLANSPLSSQFTAGNRSRNLSVQNCPMEDVSRNKRGPNSSAAPTFCTIGALNGTTCADSINFTPLTLTPGWQNFALGGAAASIGFDCTGQVHLKGSISTTGNNPIAFTLPQQFWPLAWIYIPISLGGSTKGRLVINPENGQVSVEAQNGWQNAQARTSLEGASYAIGSIGSNGFSALQLLNGWSQYGTRDAAVSSQGGIVRLQGSIRTSNTNMMAFQLPPGTCPTTDTYVTVDLCSATKGRLLITSAGHVTVQPEGAVSNAQCFTSLEGAWFSLSSPNYTTATLAGSWTHAPYSTRSAAYSVEGGLVRLRGAVAAPTTNSAMTIFNLPASAAPSAAVWLPIGLCNAKGGRLHITTAGAVTVAAETANSEANCFTSLEGVWFGR